MRGALKRGEAGKPYFPPLPGYKEGSDWTHFTGPTSGDGEWMTEERKGMTGRNSPLSPTLPIPSPCPRIQYPKACWGPQAGCMCVWRGGGGARASFFWRSEITAEADSDHTGPGEGS